MVALGNALTSASADVEAFSPLQVRSLSAALQRDPPLLLWTLLRVPAESFLTLTELAEFLATSMLDDFAGGDWMLSAPQITPSQQRHWSRLMAVCRQFPPGNWREHAAEWLQVMGPAVDPDWIASLPRVLCDDERTADSTIDGSRLLQRIARARSRELVTESSLSRLAEQRKLGAAKQLAYGLSHEINNPLANISARAQQLLRDESEPSRRKSLEQIVAQVYRAHEMIAGLMFFANPPQPNVQQVDLNGVLDEVVEEFLDQAEQADIRLLGKPAASAASVRADRTMVLEAVRGLVRNSIEAIGMGGTVVISLEDATDTEGGRFWSLHVADSGPGLSKEASEHAFDPFYSGREAGRGLGLGLCRAYRVAKLHQATIRVSGGLAGCVATLTLPAWGRRLAGDG